MPRRVNPLLFLLLLLLPLSANAREHTLKQGDTIAEIAHWYAVSRSDLMKLNNVTKPGQLRLGDVLIIPDKLLGNARRRHVVKKGDTLARIAKKYKVKRKALRELNRLRKNEVLKLGRTLAIPNRPGDNGPEETTAEPGKTTVPRGMTHLDWAGGVKGLVISAEAVEGGVMHTVQPGQTISMIARAYYTDGKKLARANKINKKNPLKAGMEIFIKGARRPVPVRTGDYKPHTVTLIRVKKTKRVKMKLINPSGTARKSATNQLRLMLGYKWMHPRLVDLFQRIAERFPGHAIELLSGYRKHDRRKKKTRSPHSKGVAVDFRLQGVSNDLLYEFINSFEKVGAGYYPNSVHVHLDVRDRDARWTDVSGRGEKALYVKPEDERHWENIKNEVAPIDTDSSAATGE